MNSGELHSLLLGRGADGQPRDCQKSFSSAARAKASQLNRKAVRPALDNQEFTQVAHDHDAVVAQVVLDLLALGYRFDGRLGSFRFDDPRAGS